MKQPPTALITGASRGIGRGIAIHLAALGYRLFLNFAHNRTAAQETARECQKIARRNRHRVSPPLLLQADISKPTDSDRLVRRVRRVTPRLDLLVNNAGIAPKVRADLLETSEASFDEVLGTNLKGPFFLTQSIARWMTETNPTPPEGKAGMIIFIGSISSYTASTQRGEYCISKAGVSMLTSLFASRLAPHGVQVFEIRPGIISSDMTAGVKERYDGLIAGGLTPIQRWGTPDDVGRAVAALAGGSFPFSTGEVFNVDGGFHLRRL